jgi:ATP-dependent helicase STH1/SNF2
MYLRMEGHSVYAPPDMKVTRADNKVMQCRKIWDLLCVFMESYYVNSVLFRACGKFELLDRILPNLPRTRYRVLICSQRAELLDILEDLLNSLQFKWFHLDGGRKGDLSPQVIEDFNAEIGEYFAFLLSMEARGFGLSLQSADRAII